MARFAARMALGAAALLAGAGAAAQDSPRSSPDDPEIVVSGQEVAEQIRDFVGALTEAPPRGQLSRFEHRVCPAAIGVPPAQKAAMVDRIRRVAESAGLELGGANCIPNVLLIVTSDKRAFLETLRRKHGYYFGNLSPAQVRRLVREPGPATVWQLQGPPLDSDGSELQQGGEVALPGAEYYVNRTTRPLSRITASARPQFQAAAVVVEAGALDGLTTLQLADYAAMRAFARTDPSRLPANTLPTILKVLDAPMGSEVPLSLTAWDLGFLQALYASRDNLYAASQRSEIRQRLAQQQGTETRGE